ncbi:MAG: GldG family protein, partial [bacterium]
MKSRQTLLSGLSTAGALALLVVALVAVNVFAGVLPLRLDVTEKSLFTLSKGSKAVLGKLTEPVTVKYYFRESLENVPLVLKTYARRVRDLLREYEANSDGKLFLETYDPRPDTDDEEWATRYGLSGAQLPNGARLIHGLVVLSEGKEAVVPFFDPRREKFLEYDITEAITRIRTKSRQTLGVISSLPMIFPGFAPPGQRPPDWAVIQELRKGFKIENLAGDELLEIAEEIKLLLVVHPKALSDQALYALDQFVMRGGRMMVFTDPFSRLDTRRQRQIMPDFKSDLKKLFSAWKIKFEGSKVVVDRVLATRVNTQTQGLVNYPVWISLKGDSFNRESVITGELGDVILLDAGSFEPEKDFKQTFTPLLTTSQQSGTVDAMTVRMVGPFEVAKSAKYDGKSRVLSALLSGKFASAFPAGPPKAKPKKDGAADAKPPERKLPHLAAPKADATILLVGDSDFLSDDYSVRTVNFFGQAVLTPINNNLNFVLNAADFLAGNQDLIHVRSRGTFSRPFTVVAALRVEAQKKFQQEEEALSQSLEAVRKKLRGLQEKKEGAQKVLLTNEQVAAIREFRLEEQTNSRALREVRKVLRQDIETLAATLR